MFENAALGIALLDHQGRVLKSNRALQQLLSCTAETLPAILSDLLNLDQDGAELALFQKLIAGKHRSYQLEKRFLAPNQQVRWGRLTVSLVQGDSNEPTFATCTLEEITQPEQLELAQPVMQSLATNPAKPQNPLHPTVSTHSQSLATSVEPRTHILEDTENRQAAPTLSQLLAKEAKFSTLQSDFAGIVSHELRSSLNNIFCCAKLLESQTQEWADQKRLKYFQRIQVNIKRSNQLLDDLSVIGLLGAGNIQLKPAFFDLTEFCRNLVEEIQQSAGSQHRLTFISQSQRSSACMDVKLLRQILNQQISLPQSLVI